jgi:hypothetical protein
VDEDLGYSAQHSILTQIKNIKYQIRIHVFSGTAVSQGKLVMQPEDMGAVSATQVREDSSLHTGSLQGQESIQRRLVQRHQAKPNRPQAQIRNKTGRPEESSEREGSVGMEQLGCSKSS